jgi:hypothetical protein
MKKKVAFLTLSLVLILSLVSTSALAKENQTNGKPFEELWDKISEIVDSLDNLQAQITEIQLIEGPQGPQGEEGPQGPPGAMPFSGQICPDGQFVVGFDEEGNIICGSVPSPPPENIVINEVDYAQYGGDTAEFIEIFNSGGVPVSLEGIRLELWNGATESIYATYNLDLAGSELLAGGYLVIGSPIILAQLDSSVLTIPLSPSINGIRDGAPADGMRLVYFIDTVLDGLAYGGSMPGIGEGNYFYSLDSEQAAASVGRLPDGADTNDNLADFALCQPSAGYANEQYE